MASKFFERAYRTTDQPDVQDLYQDWADTYDADVAENGYETPRRCAVALAALLTPKDAPIFDFACGTGLSGAALAAQGFTVIDGVDISEAMLDIARARGVYRDLRRIDPDADPGIGPGSYAAIAAVGALSPGAAPASYLDKLIAALDPGGLLVFSFNDHTLSEPDYTDRLARHLAADSLREIFREHDTHLAGLGSKSTVYVLEKL